VKVDAVGDGRFCRNVGYGASADTYVEIGGTDNGFVNNGSASSWRQYVSGNEYGQSLKFDAFIRSVGWTTRATLDSSGNLGIGTSSPASQVSGTAKVVQLQGATGGIGSYKVTNSDSTVTGEFWASSTGVVGLSATSNNPLLFSTNNTEQMRLDSSGSLGLGVTPSAWQSTKKAFQIGAVGAINGDSATVALSNNAYIDSSGTTRYLTTSTAAYYYQNSGQHVWFNAPSGTAGNAISFSQAMTLDASGNLQLGTSSGSSTRRLTVYGSVGSAASTSIALQNSTSGTASGDGFTMELEGVNGYLYNYESGPLIFGTANTERARIDSSGNLLVGTTAVQSDERMNLRMDGNSQSGLIVSDSMSTAGNAVSVRFYRSTSTQVGSITTTLSSTLYNITSDQRLKENIVDAPEFGSVIDSIKVRSYDWKTNSEHQRAGFIAQELVTVAPEAVHQPADPEEMMAVDYSKLVPMLVKEIQSLRARLAAANI
jgi:surface antigen